MAVPEASLSNAGINEWDSEFEFGGEWRRQDRKTSGLKDAVAEPKQASSIRIRRNENSAVATCIDFR